MDKGLLRRYINNNCTEEEVRAVLDWFGQSSENPEGKSLLYKLWEELSDEESNPHPNFDFILDKIHHSVNLYQSGGLLEEAENDKVRHIRRRHFINIFSKIAAILFMPVLVFGVYMSYKFQSNQNRQKSEIRPYIEVFSSVDAITKVSLPDGSNVWLNRSSSLKYPTSFKGSTRNVELIGEAFFDVNHIQGMPFIVEVGDIQIKAVGTTFNVMAYSDEDKIETSLVEGQVILQSTDSKGKELFLLKMKPTDFAVIRKGTNEVSARTILDDRYVSWKEGKLVFYKEPMDEVVKKLSRWFNVDIQMKDPELHELTYTATFINESLPQVLELMSMVSPVSYAISKRQSTNSEIFTKKKVILSYRTTNNEINQY